MPACQRGTKNSPSASPARSSLPAQRDGPDLKGEKTSHAPERVSDGGEGTPLYGVWVWVCVDMHTCSCGYFFSNQKGFVCESWSCPPTHTPAPLQASVLKLLCFAFCFQHLRGAEDCPLAKEDDRDRHTQRVRLRGLPHEAGRKGETVPSGPLGGEVAKSSSRRRACRCPIWFSCFFPDPAHFRHSL